MEGMRVCVLVCVYLSVCISLFLSVHVASLKDRPEIAGREEKNPPLQPLASAARTEKVRKVRKVCSGNLTTLEPD